MGSVLAALNLLFAFLLWGATSQRWPLVSFLVIFELLWVLLCLKFAMVSLLFNDLLWLFVAIGVLFFSATELVLGVASLFLILHGQRQQAI